MRERQLTCVHNANTLGGGTHSEKAGDVVCVAGTHSFTCRRYPFSLLQNHKMCVCASVCVCACVCVHACVCEIVVCIHTCIDPSSL